MKTTIILSAVSILCFASGCDLMLLLQGEPGSGVSATEEREIGEFSKLEFAGAANITIVCGKSPSLTLTTDDNLLPLITTKVDDGTLEISSTKRINPTIVPTYEITTGNISSIEMAGSGNITVTDIDGEEFDFELAGSGKLEATGVVERVSIEIAGSGSVDLDELIAKQVSVEIAGSGRGTVYAIENLDVEIAGSGKIDYIGSPEVKQDIAGSGRVRQVEGSASAQVDATVDTESEEE